MMYSLPFTFISILILSLASTIIALGAVQLFSDSSCQVPCGSSISLLSKTCRDTNDTAAISAVSLPSRDNGKPILVISDLNECQPPSISPQISSGEVGVCLYFPTGSTIGSAAFIYVGEVTTVSSNPPTLTTAVKSSTIPKSIISSTNSSSQSPSEEPGTSQSHRRGIGFSD